MVNKNSILESSLNLSTRFKCKSTEEFNNGVDHVINLLNQSFVLMNNNMYSGSFFMSITAIEEVSKLHLSIFMKHDSTVKFNKDILTKHNKKQMLAVSPAFQIGNRLPNVLGQNTVDKLLSWIYNNKIMDLKNKSIYWSCENNVNTFPEDHINQKLSQEALLLAIEIFDDNLVGYSSHTFECSKCTDLMFKKVSESYLKIKD